MSKAVQVAEKLADEFRTKAAEHDRTGEFPAASYARMKEAGYLASPVPSELGGFGAGLAEMSRAQQALARGCASTALAVNMHLFQVGTTADAPLLVLVTFPGADVPEGGVHDGGHWNLDRHPIDLGYAAVAPYRYQYVVHDYHLDDRLRRCDL